MQPQMRGDTVVVDDLLLFIVLLLGEEVLDLFRELQADGRGRQPLPLPSSMQKIGHSSAFSDASWFQTPI